MLINIVLHTIVYHMLFAATWYSVLIPLLLLIAYKHKHKKIVYENGTIYEGEVNAMRQPHGYGKFIYPITDSCEVRNPVYIGRFKNGLEHGEGIYDYGSELPDYYEGEFKNGKFHGKGIRVYENGKCQYGIFRNNRFIKAYKI
jgi:hypothetical protein